MDLCLWYAKCKEEMSQPNYKRKWERRGMSNNIERFQKEKHTEEYEFEGIVRKREGIGWFYCGRYLLEKPKDGRYQEGDTIRITTSEENTKECFLSDEDNIVDRFVYLCNIRKM